MTLARIAHAINSVETFSPTNPSYLDGMRVLRMLLIALKQIRFLFAEFFKCAYCACY